MNKEELQLLYNVLRFRCAKPGKVLYQSKENYDKAISIVQRELVEMEETEEDKKQIEEAREDYKAGQFKKARDSVTEK